MEFFTLDRDYIKQEVIDEFESAIWTERFFGDGEVQIKVEDNPAIRTKMLPGQLVGLVGSDEPAIIETHSSDKGLCEIRGTLLSPWLNNRFYKATHEPEGRATFVRDTEPAHQLHAMVRSWTTIEGQGTYLSDDFVPGDPLPGHVHMGIPNASRLIIPDFFSAEEEIETPPGSGIWSYVNRTPNDPYGNPIPHMDGVEIPFGPMYDALRGIAEVFKIGMKIVRVSNGDGTYKIVYDTFAGLDRSSGQNARPLIRFSPKLESLINPKELESDQNYKNLVYGVAPEVDSLWYFQHGPGIADFAAGKTGFDLRAELIFTELSQEELDSINWPEFGGPGPIYKALTDHEALKYISVRKYVHMADGEVPSGIQAKYGTDYNMGDVVEIEGSNELITKAQVTEYIRSQDSTGEKAYPAVSVLE